MSLLFSTIIEKLIDLEYGAAPSQETFNYQKGRIV